MHYAMQCRDYKVSLIFIPFKVISLKKSLRDFFNVFCAFTFYPFIIIISVSVSLSMLFEDSRDEAILGEPNLS